MKIGIASDHAGFELKQFLINWLNENNFEVTDFGTNSTASCDYPNYAHPLADAVETGACVFGIAICGSGNGINMTVNKHQGIRSALCWETVALAAKKNWCIFLTALPACHKSSCFSCSDYWRSRRSYRVLHRWLLQSHCSLPWSPVRWQ